MSVNSRTKIFFFFFFNDTATTEIYTLSLHDALPISVGDNSPWLGAECVTRVVVGGSRCRLGDATTDHTRRSEEHTSELQSQSNLVCRLLLEKKKKHKKLLIIRIGLNFGIIHFTYLYV